MHILAIIKRITTVSYWLSLAALAAFALALHAAGVSNAMIFHRVAFYLPAIAAIFVVSLQIDYLDSIAKGGNVNIRGRIIDSVHWLMLESMMRPRIFTLPPLAIE